MKKEIKRGQRFFIHLLGEVLECTCVGQYLDDNKEVVYDLVVYSANANGLRIEPAHICRKEYDIFLTKKGCLDNLFTKRNKEKAWKK